MKGLIQEQPEGTFGELLEDNVELPPLDGAEANYAAEEPEQEAEPEPEPDPPRQTVSDRRQALLQLARKVRVLLVPALAVHVQPGIHTIEWHAAQPCLAVDKRSADWTTLIVMSTG